MKREQLGEEVLEKVTGGSLNHDYKDGHGVITSTRDASIYATYGEMYADKVHEYIQQTKLDFSITDAQKVQHMRDEGWLDN